MALGNFKSIVEKVDRRDERLSDVVLRPDSGESPSSLDIGHTSATTANSAPLILREACASLLQRADQELYTALALEVACTSQLVEVIRELHGSLAEVERLESLLVVGIGCWG